MIIKPYLRRSILRFLGLKTFANLLILSGLLWLGYGLSPIVETQVSYWWESRNPAYAQALKEYQERSNGFNEILQKAPPLPEEPVNRQASIVIPAIKVNAPIVFDVSTGNKSEYFDALKKGVAHAKGSAKPADNTGNTYLFAHSTLNPAEIKKYGAVFTLLHKLQPGNRISVFQDGTRYDYLVTQKEVVSGFNTTPLTRNPQEPILTLQTCDPPGIPLNRLIVTAKRVGVYPPQK